MSELHWNLADNSAKENPVAISLVGPYMFVSGVVSIFLPGNAMFSHFKDASLIPWFRPALSGLFWPPVGGSITT